MRGLPVALLIMYPVIRPDHGEPVAKITSMFLSRTSFFPARAKACSGRSEEHTSELQSRPHLVCRLLLEKKKNKQLSTQSDSVIKAVLSTCTASSKRLF